ncbi:MAG: adenylosuccinate lyase [bacterium]|nr:adenylosuccinate lyase [bacterium]
MKSFDYSTYLSPFTWRYGTEEMREIWSEIHKRKLWRRIWVELAKTQHKERLINKKELDDIIKNQDAIDIEKSHETEKIIKHDLMAEIKTFAQSATIGGGKIHLGATSYDIEDNAETIRFKESLKLIEKSLKDLLSEFGRKIKEYKDLPCMAYTHLQPAEPTTLGYRFAIYAQDILFDLNFLDFIKRNLKGKGIKGAVGTSASYVRLTNNSAAEQMEKSIMKELGIDPVDIATQVAPRKIEYFVSIFLSGVAQTLNKFAFDVRIMQSPGFGEWQEPFSEKQVGSSAMPFKRNPWKSEQICSLARIVNNLSNISKENSSNMLLERTLDDSANRRIYLPEMFLAIDEMLQSSVKITEGIVINKKQIEKNLNTYGPFAITEAVLMETVKNGADRQQMHEILRDLSMKAWEEIQKDNVNPLAELIKNNTTISKFIEKDKLKTLLDPREHLGLAPQRCTKFLSKLNDELSH